MNLKPTLKITNILLIIAIVLFSFYAIILNQKIYYFHQKNIKIEKSLNNNIALNNQLKLEIIMKTSNIFIDKYAKNNLKMGLPKKIHTLN